LKADAQKHTNMMKARGNFEEGMKRRSKVPRDVVKKSKKPAKGAKKTSGRGLSGDSGINRPTQGCSARLPINSS